LPGERASAWGCWDRALPVYAWPGRSARRGRRRGSCRGPGSPAPWSAPGAGTRPRCGRRAGPAPNGEHVAQDGITPPDDGFGTQTAPSGRQALREQKGASASRRPRAPLQPPAAERYGVAAAHWFAGSRAAGLSLKSGGHRDFALELCGGPRRPVDLVASGGGRRGGEAERRFGAVDLWRLRRVGASIGARPCEAHVVTGLEGAARRSM
jgi:hypothetical protein